MHTSVRFEKELPLIGLNDKGQKTLFDASMDFSGPAKYASPMEIVLQSLAACSMMDIITILKKMRKELITLVSELDAVRAEEHPRVFTSINIRYRLESPDCTPDDFEKAARLSIEKYCSVAAMLRGSGCAITWDSELV
ncbi:MAG TPA: OsmC family protein [Chlorobaculum sp.]|nr:OsmC family protein [Chlorobaculum sp.]